MKSMKDELGKLILKVTDLQSKLSWTCQCLKEEIGKRSISETSQNTLMKQLAEAKISLASAPTRENSVTHTRQIFICLKY